ncbi:MAG: CBS domain-containing protein [Gemmatimonadota bacterium]
MDAPQTDDLIVEDAVEPAQYRVYPDTPLGEVIDLMVRRAARAIPVVGERYEVLGIITTGDALGHVLREGPSDDSSVDAEDDTRTARDIMTRAVLCVTEAQPLMDAARMMVNRQVEQLPVVRDGELVGLITRDAVLQRLHADTDHEHEEDRDDA